MKNSYDQWIIGMVAHLGALILFKISLETLQQGDNLQQLPFIKMAFYKTESLAQAYGYFHSSFLFPQLHFQCFAYGYIKAKHK